jgi:P27 family predicted phage terminase small subunit
MAGTPRKPTALKKAEGTFRPGRAPQNEPKPKARLPRGPNWLDPIAKREWRRAGKLLNELGLMTEVYLMAFACYCTAVSDLTSAQKVLQKEGLTCRYVNKNGYANIVRRPQVQMKNDALKQIKAFAVEFGMTPASRTRVEAQLPPDPEADLIKEFLM